MKHWLYSISPKLGRVLIYSSLQETEVKLDLQRFRKRDLYHIICNRSHVILTYNISIHIIQLKYFNH